MVEVNRLGKQLKYMEDSNPSFMKEILHEKHMQRILKNQIKREVREEHTQGVADPGRLAANLEKRMYFSEYIKVDDLGKKKHIVNK